MKMNGSHVSTTMSPAGPFRLPNHCHAISTRKAMLQRSATRSKSFASKLQRALAMRGLSITTASASAGSSNPEAQPQKARPIATSNGGIFTGIASA